MSAETTDWRDLVDRLRRDSSTPYGCHNCDGIQREEAADLIEALQAEVKKLKAMVPAARLDRRPHVRDSAAPVATDRGDRTR